MALPKNWRLETVGDVCSEIVDCVNKTAPAIDAITPYKMIRTTNVRHGRVSTESVKYVDAKTFQKWTSRCVPRRNDIVLTREAPLGEVGLIRSDESLFLGQRTMLYRANETDLTQQFLYYAMQGQIAQGQIRSWGSGATVEHLRVPDASKFEIPVPEMDEQRKIAAVLTAYDDLIENNRQRIALLETMAEEIYREWFVRLRFPGHEHTPIHKGVPEGWRTGVLANLVREASKSTRPGAHLEGRKYIPIDTLPAKSVSPDDGYSFEEAKSSLVLFEENDILFGAMRPYQHKVCIANVKGISRTTCFVLRARDEKYSGYAYWTVNQPATIDYASLICNGVDRPYVVWNRGFERLPIFIPTAQIAEQFQDIWIPMFEQMKVLQRQNKRLSRTRGLLLNRLISGKLRVDELDIQFPPSMREATATA